MAKGFPMTKNESGNRYGKLFVIRQVEYLINVPRRARWLCKCDCGNEIIVFGTTLRYGGAVSCKSCSHPAKEISVFNSLLSSNRSNARARGYSWELTKEQARKLYLGNCHYCGIEPNQVHMIPDNPYRFIYNGIDRVDNSVGYIFENCVSCCGICNRMKRDSSIEEFKNHIQNIFNRWASK